MINTCAHRLHISPAKAHGDWEADLAEEHTMRQLEGAFVESQRPLVTADPDCARFIAEGALMRLDAGHRCYKAYRAHLWPSLAATG